MFKHWPIRVIHWEHNKPKELAGEASPDAFLRYSPICEKQGGKPVGFQLRWTFRLISPTEQIISYIAEQDFTTASPETKTTNDLWNIVAYSNLQFRLEFDKRKIPINLNYTITPVKKQDINLDQMLSDLKG